VTGRRLGRRLTRKGSQAVASRASAIGGCRACTRYMSAMREELHHLVDLLPEAGLRPALELIRARSSPRNSAAEVRLCDTGVLLAAGNVKDHAHQACLLLRHA
jgi:hypothetical protein